MGAEAPILFSQGVNMQLHASRFGLAEQRRNQWYVTLPAGVPYDEVFKAGFWAHIAQKLRPTDTIEVIDDEMSFRAILMVRAAARLSASVVEISKVMLGDAPADEDTAKIFVEWRGPHGKHSVVRSGPKGKEVLASGFDTKEAAEIAKIDHMKIFNLKAA
jgi:hypothetical protein